MSTFLKELLKYYALTKNIILEKDDFEILGHTLLYEKFVS